MSNLRTGQKQVTAADLLARLASGSLANLAIRGGRPKTKPITAAYQDRMNDKLPAALRKVRVERATVTLPEAQRSWTGSRSDSAPRPAGTPQRLERLPTALKGRWRNPSK
jgi:hypothetical protein